MRKLGSKSYYTKKLDALLSKKVRERGLCQWCNSTKNLQAAHIISRKNRALRWDLQNLICLCSACHFKAHQDPLEFAALIKSAFKSSYKYLMKKKNLIIKRSAKDLKEMLEELNK